MYEYRAFVRSIYDGDTIRVDIDLGFGIQAHNQIMRLVGINAPEMIGDDHVKGVIARDALREKILQKDVIIQTIKDRTEKYGRYLAWVFLDGENINTWLIAHGYAVPFMVPKDPPVLHHADLVIPATPVEPASSSCVTQMQRDGKTSWPRTCPVCKLGPCQYYERDGKTRR